MSMPKIAGFSLSLLSALVLTACGGGDDTPTNSQTSLVIPFAAKAGAVDIDCSAHLTGLGTTADGGTVSDFAFYVHDIKLTLKDGSKASVTLEDNDFQDPANGVALLDFQNKTDSCAGADKATNKEVTLTVSNVKTTDIAGIEFKVGVPEAANHHNASISRAPYNRSGLFWKWQTGHKFMRMDIKPDSKVKLAYDMNGSTEANAFLFHLGSTDCVGDPATGGTVSCAYGNRPAVSLSGVSVTGMTTSTVVFDYAKLVSEVNLNLDTVAPTGCMSGLTDVECAAVFGRLGLPFGTTQAASAQTVFSVAN